MAACWKMEEADAGRRSRICFGRLPARPGDVRPSLAPMNLVAAAGIRAGNLPTRSRVIVGKRWHHTICTKSYAKLIGEEKSIVHRRTYTKGRNDGGETREFSLLKPFFRTSSKGNWFEKRPDPGEMIQHRLPSVPQPYNHGWGRFREVDACQPEQNDIDFCPSRSRT